MILPFLLHYSNKNNISIKVLETDTPIEKIVLYAQHEFQYTTFEYFERLVDFSNIRNIPFVIIVCSNKFSSPWHDTTDERYKNIELVYWKTFWLSETLIRIQRTNTLRYEEMGTYVYPFISLNNRAHHFRCLMMDTLAKYNLIDNAAISWHQAGYSNWKIEDYNFKHWTPEIKILDVEYTMVENLHYAQIFVLPTEFSQSFMQLVAETTLLDMLVSEKTCMPLLFGKPFLVFGPMRFHEMLSVEYGFQLYDEIFDYSFDKESDLNIRCDMLLQNVKRIYNSSTDELQEMHRKILPKILFNQDLARQLVFDIDNIPEIIKESVKNSENIFEPNLELRSFASMDIVNFVTDNIQNK